MSVVPSIIVLVITALVVFRRELTALRPRQLRRLRPSLRELSDVQPGALVQTAKAGHIPANSPFAEELGC
jgi:hypothetical protein